MTLLGGSFRHQRFPPHFHDFYVVGFSEDPEWFICKGRKQEARRLDLGLINPGEVHEWDLSAAPRHVYHALYLEPETVRCLLGIRDPDASTPLFRRTLARDVALAEDLLAASGQLRPGSSSRSARDELLEALHRLFRRYGEDRGPSGGTTLRPEVESTRAFIQRRYAEPLTLEALARRVDWDKYRLARLFKEEVGLAPYQYLIQIRVDVARRRLLLGEKAAEVALAVGFCHQSHLTEHFRRLTGVTPVRFASGLAAASTA